MAFLYRNKYAYVIFSHAYYLFFQHLLMYVHNYAYSPEEGSCLHLSNDELNTSLNSFYIKEPNKPNNIFINVITVFLPIAPRFL